ncbi:MAG: DUF2283 domain-containing protein [Chloroflexi bacterium]|nr:DUF2283 domain-containing protein [Chloroflexota bacterium]
MKIEYTRSSDALYIRLRQAPIIDSRDVEEGVTVDLDGEGHIVGLEVLDASERLGWAELINVNIENLPVDAAEVA